MTKQRDEVWAVTPTDTKAHLYFFEDGAVRRLCHPSRFTGFDIVGTRDIEKCRLCLNIRGMIPTRRRKKARPTA